ncbi:MAG TPA: S9 family peptidase [Gammaproteobacteria bacterium]
MRLLLCLLALMTVALPAEARLLQPKDFAALHEVDDPRLSPDGHWVAYTVRTTDLDKDKRATNLWLAKWDGSEERQLTFGDKSQYSPRWSPDSRHLAFLSGRGGDDQDGDQLWLMDLAGGEARRLTELKGGVEDYAWAPDGRHLVLVVRDADPAAHAKEDEAPPPIVITRYYFKEDRTGYLTERRTHLFLLDMDGGEPKQLTSGAHDELLPAFSPDGKSIAYVTKRGADPDRSDDWDVYVIPAAGGAERQLTHSPEADGNPDWESPPAWSPDGKSIAYLHGGPAKEIEYAADSLAVIAAAGGEPRVLTAKLDRNVYSPQWSTDGRRILVRLEQDRHTVLAQVDAASGNLTELSGMEGTLPEFDAAAGKVAMLWSSPAQPREIYAWEGGKRRALSRQNTAFLKGLDLAKVEEVAFKSADGTEVHGFLTYPAGYSKGTRYPLISFNHGGPQSQSEAEFDFNWQLFSANGYAVVATNYRGSTGRGTPYAMGIYASWGGKDVEDVRAAVDEMIRRGIADPERLGVGGWSYGGMLTNYVIASDSRFKAAVSGASISNILAGFGTDQYIRDYENELGVPWKDLDTWMKVSYPYYHADRIRTPTLFLGGGSDFNVTLLNQEQMYEALQSLKVPTGLVIYPGQYHRLTRPSYILDRYKRYVDWYAKYLKG